GKRNDHRDRARRIGLRRRDVGRGQQGERCRYRELFHASPSLLLLPDARRRHSGGLMLAALMIGHHLSISALWKAPSASGVCSSGFAITCPSSMSRCRTAASARVSITAASSLATTSLGVPLGAHSPFQNEMYMPDTPTSSM